MKRALANKGKYVVILLVVAMLFSITAEAKSCDHSFGNTDVCSKCGHLNVHAFDSSITFYTIKKHVPIWSKPTKNSERKETVLEKDTMLQVDGILRNNYGNIWLRLTNNRGYVFIDNVYLYLEVLVIENYQFIWPRKDNVMGLGVFAELVRPNGRADYKHWLDPSNKGIIYNVKIDSEFYQIAAETLGNIHYGYLGRLIGIDESALLYGGGMVNIYTHFQNNWHIIGLFNECRYSYCDEALDVNNVKSGIRYYDTGSFTLS